jgi:transposase
MGTRTSRINALRGFCREQGMHVPVGARTGLDAMAQAVADDQSPIPALLRPLMQQLIDEIRVLEVRALIPGLQAVDTTASASARHQLRIRLDLGRESMYEC